MLITLKKVYHTPKGKLRAQVVFNGQTRTLRIETVGKGCRRQVRVSTISNPKYLPSFSIKGINHTTQSIDLEVYSLDIKPSKIVSLEVGEVKEI